MLLCDSPSKEELYKKLSLDLNLPFLLLGYTVYLSGQFIRYS